MPFTPTHIAAAIPVAWLCRWRLPFTALAIGTTISDIPVFFPRLMSYGSTHTMTGVLTHCLPLGLLLYYIYHGLLKRPLVDLLPTTLRDRLLPYINRKIDFDPARVALVASLIALGATTHVLWDSFTHADRWGTQLFPWLNEIAFHSTLFQPHWYAILQHGSSILLLPPMTFGFLWWIMRQPQLASSDHRLRIPLGIAWSAIGLICLGGIIHWWMIVSANTGYSLTTTIHIAVTRMGAVFFAVALLYCLGMQVLWLFERQPETEPGSTCLEST